MRALGHTTFGVSNLFHQPPGADAHAVVVWEGRV
jgi:hypothetical protein